MQLTATPRRVNVSVFLLLILGDTTAVNVLFGDPSKLLGATCFSYPFGGYLKRSVIERHPWPAFCCETPDWILECKVYCQTVYYLPLP